MGLFRKSVTWNGGNDEFVSKLTIVIVEFLDGSKVFVEIRRPSIYKYHGNNLLVRFGFWFNMNEVNHQTFDLSLKMIETLDLFLLAAPIKLLGPIIRDHFKIVSMKAVFKTFYILERFVVSGFVQSIAKI